MDKIKEVKHILDLYQDGYISEAGGNFFDLPIYKRERVVELRDKLAFRICQLFPKSPNNPDGYEPKPETDILMVKGTEHLEERIPLYKPDKSRLLSHEFIKVATATEWLANSEGKFLKSDFTLDEVVRFVRKEVKAQDAKTASLIEAECSKKLEQAHREIDDLSNKVIDAKLECQARVERIFREIGSYLGFDIVEPEDLPSWWQALKEGVK